MLLQFFSPLIFVALPIFIEFCETFRFLLRYTFEDNLTEDWNFVKHLQDVFDSDTLVRLFYSLYILIQLQMTIYI